MAWENAGEMRTCFGKGDGFKWWDIRVHRLGREFRRRLFACHHDEEVHLLPSEIIELAGQFRPDRIPAPAETPHVPSSTSPDHVQRAGKPPRQASLPR